MNERFRSWAVAPLVVGLGSLAACGGTPASSGTASAPSAGAASACRVRSQLRPLGETRQGSTVALGSLGGKAVAFVADEDGKSVSAVDIDAGREIGRTKLGGTPSQLLIDEHGRLLVLLRDKGAIVSLEAEDVTGTLQARCQKDAPADAVGLASNGQQVIVSGGFSRTVALLDGETLATKKYLDVPREPRSVVLSGDGKTAFVSHAVGSTMSVVDLGAGSSAPMSLRGAPSPDAAARLSQMEQMAAMMKGTPSEASSREFIERAKMDARGKDSCQGFAVARLDSGRVFAPQVFVDPGSLESTPAGYGDGRGEGTEVAAIAVIDERTRQPLLASMDSAANALRRPMFSSNDTIATECMLPRAAAVDVKSGALLVTCLGIDALVAYDASSAQPARAERKRWSVGAGPTGVAVDAKGHRAVVFAQFDRTLNVIPLDVEPKSGEPSRPPLNPRIALAPLTGAEAVPSAVALGRVLFHASGDLRISKDGRACASCHPDGRDDAITWATPQGPRRSVMLAGRVEHSAPYSWSGVENDLHTHLHTTFERLDGTGLRNVELDAIVAYVQALPAPAPIREDATLVARGKTIFHSKEAACASCHNGGALTDNGMHDVKSRKANDEKAEFNTPTLHLVGGAGPYFHDGRYATLRDLLVGTDGTMGHTRHLRAEGELDALEAYVRSL